jgi:hypothetical protein
MTDFEAPLAAFVENEVAFILLGDAGRSRTDRRDSRSTRIIVSQRSPPSLGRLPALTTCKPYLCSRWTALSPGPWRPRARPELQPDDVAERLDLLGKIGGAYGDLAPDAVKLRVFGRVDLHETCRRPSSRSRGNCGTGSDRGRELLQLT